MNLSKKEESDQIRFGIKLLVNFVIIFGLSLSTFSLLSNMLCTIQKISTNSQYNSNIFLERKNYKTILNRANELIQTDSKKYYDCKKSILSVEECDQINKYYDIYFNLFKFKHFENKVFLSSFDESLKANTSFFKH
jgi:hypothetical protein